MPSLFKSIFLVSPTFIVNLIGSLCKIISTESSLIEFTVNLCFSSFKLNLTSLFSCRLKEVPSESLILFKMSIISNILTPYSIFLILQAK